MLRERLDDVQRKDDVQRQQVGRIVLRETIAAIHACKNTPTKKQSVSCAWNSRATLRGSNQTANLWNNAARHRLERRCPALKPDSQAF
jgi:hypothetical protein